MSCCSKTTRTDLWTSIPPYRQPTEIQPGENIDCFMKRSSQTDNNMAPEEPPQENTIDNTSLVSTVDRNSATKAAKVDETFVLTADSTRTPTEWVINVDGQDGVGPLAPEMTFDSASGKLVGEITDPTKRAKNYKVKITSNDAEGMIDSREFNLYIKGEKEDEIRFVMPLVGPGARVTSFFGPRKPPASGASSTHKGIDMSCTGDARGDIVASADGIVTMAGPASGFGKWIHIQHKDSSGKLVATTLYAHMHDIYVKVGQQVSAGQVIAKESNNGIGSGAHLHFEIHKGGYKNPVDPMPYLEGSVPLDTAAADKKPSTTAAAPPAGPSSPPVKTNSGSGMVAGQSESNDDCTPNPSNIDTAVEHEDTTNPKPIADILPEDNKSATTAPCVPPENRPSKETVLAEMNRAMDDGGLTDQVDRDYLMRIAIIESTLDPYAKNPASSATGLFQFLTKTAHAMYTGAGIYSGPAPVPCEMLCDPYLATKAYVYWYKSELVKYWDRFVASGKTKVAGLTIVPTSFSGSAPPHYDGVGKQEFIYMCHHDGCGTVKDGVDKGGLAYWRRRGAG